MKRNIVSQRYARILYILPSWHLHHTVYNLHNSDVYKPNYKPNYGQILVISELSWHTHYVFPEKRSENVVSIPKTRKKGVPFGRNRAKWVFLAKNSNLFFPKKPILAKPEFSQYVHEVIPVEDPKCSFYNKKPSLRWSPARAQENVMKNMGEST